MDSKTPIVDRKLALSLTNGWPKYDEWGKPDLAEKSAMKIVSSIHRTKESFLKI